MLADIKAFTIWPSFALCWFPCRSFWKVFYESMKNPERERERENEQRMWSLSIKRHEFSINANSCEISWFIHRSLDLIKPCSLHQFILPKSFILIWKFFFLSLFLLSIFPFDAISILQWIHFSLPAKRIISFLFFFYLSFSARTGALGNEEITKLTRGHVLNKVLHTKDIDNK